MNILFKKLRDALDNQNINCKGTKAYERSIVSHSFLGILSKMINKFENFDEYETGLFVQSFDKWLDRKNVLNTPENNCDPKPGDILMVDWNINYNPELSYQHPCVVIKEINTLISVLPVSGQDSFIKEAYHPIENVDGIVWNRKVGVEDGFKKSSVVFLDRMKVISKTRIIYKIGVIDNTVFEEIKSKLCDIYFKDERDEYVQRATIQLESEFKSIIEEKNLKIDKLGKLSRFYQSRADRYRLENKQLIIESKSFKNAVDKL